MGILRATGEWLGFVDPPAAGFAGDAGGEAMRALDQMIIDFFSSGGGRVSRAEALTVPAIRRGRNLICSVATLPLITYGPDQRAHRSPFLSQIDPDVPNVVTLAQTVEDLLCESVAWWQVLERSWNGYPTAARRVDPGSVTLDPPPGRSAAPLPSGLDPRRDAGAAGPRPVWVDGVQVPARDVIRFDAPNPGLLTAGRTIRRAILLDQAAAMYAEDPRPQDYFTPADGVDPGSDETVAGILRAWRTARQSRGTAYVPAALRYNTVDSPSPADLQLVELQKQSNLDLANLIGVDPEDLGVSTTSRTYQNGTDRRRDRINDVLSAYMVAVTDRLGMRDVSRRGWAIRFDLDDYMRADPATRWQVYAAGNALRDEHDRPAISVAEIRQEERLTPLPMIEEPAGDDVDQAVTPPPAIDPDTVVDVVDAAALPAATFDVSRETSGITFAGESIGFAVDVETRTVRGTIVPYGRVGMKGGRRFAFAAGALQYGDARRVKLLRDHDPRQPLGHATGLVGGPAGVDGVFSVAPGVDQDRALELSAHGTLDGMSVGVDFDMHDTGPDPKDPTVTLIKRATLREVSLVAVPAFDDARVTSVAASRTPTGDDVDFTGIDSPAGAGDQTAPPATPTTGPPAAAGVTFDAATAAAFAAYLAAQAGDTGPGTVDPHQGGRPAAAVVTSEPVPYRFDRGGNFLPVAADEPVFSADLHAMSLARDAYGVETDAGRRVMALLRSETFAVVAPGDVAPLNPTIQRPDMYVDQREYQTPIWNMISKGAPPNGVNPFIFPKFTSASGLVGPHTLGTEPTGGTIVTGSQTVTPTATSGKASIPREVWDMGGNPAVSGIIFRQMQRGYREGLETAAATFLNTLTAAADIVIPTASVDGALAGAWDAALADLQFIRGYDFVGFVIEKVLYKAFVAAKDTTGRVLFPIINPSNANGTAASRFRTLDLGGVTGVPSWALASTAGAANNSWLFDPSTVHGWATAPMRLEFPGTAAAGTYAPVAMIDLAIWGYQAVANSDIGGVRQVTYDSVT